MSGCGPVPDGTYGGRFAGVVLFPPTHWPFFSITSSQPPHPPTPPNPASRFILLIGNYLFLVLRAPLTPRPTRVLSDSQREGFSRSFHRVWRNPSKERPRCRSHAEAVQEKGGKWLPSLLPDVLKDYASNHATSSLFCPPH